MDSQDMRSLTIYGNDDFQAIEELKKLENWKLNENKQDGNPYFLTKDEIKIYLRIVAENIVETSNVLPQDLEKTSLALAGDALLSLASDLEKAEIEHTLEISENDKKQLLRKDAE